MQYLTWHNYWIGFWICLAFWTLKASITNDWKKIVNTPEFQSLGIGVQIFVGCLLTVLMFSIVAVITFFWPIIAPFEVLSWAVKIGRVISKPAPSPVVFGPAEFALAGGYDKPKAKKCLGCNRDGISLDAKHCPRCGNKL